MRTSSTIDELCIGVQHGRQVAISRSISLLERGVAAGVEVVERVYGSTGTARTIGVTGPPGAGKSTLVDRLVADARSSGHHVAVLAVDPSSPFGGGALMGDRVRMHSCARDAAVFVRSLASRGALGGLSAVVPSAIRIMDAAGFDTVIVETVGVGQSEVDVAKMVDCTVVVLFPGAGDMVQGMKSGVMEIADVLAVNKADLPETTTLLQQLRSAVAVRGWTAVSVCGVSALTGEGVADLAAAIRRRLAFDHAELAERRRLRTRDEALLLIDSVAGSRAREMLDEVTLERALVRLDSKKLTPRATAETIVALALSRASS